MYKFPYYTEENPEKVIAFMKAYPFAVIVGIGEQYPAASHIPLDVEVQQNGKIFLKGHLMKKTDHHIAFEKNENVLVIFNGPHTHVSASWYSTPAVGSTWDYMVVHAKGKIKFTDEQGTYEAVKAITNKYEGFDKSSSFDKLPKEYVDKMLKAIVGFSIEVESLENTFKLSQNRDEESKRNIIEALYKRGDENSKAIAKEILSRLTD
ncbi:MAG: FMN-binding negative transcriptional regulator [Ferruginibacter sp.]|nr:FMN-binding negative transcriptional regulator [Bacteroidota bacterium]MBX2920124.1 FMN-binding negative transcriptional regulator [Ferruginibacter sp.]MCB0708264.1 FMN-binding negative transcriptional regulator [Chitinophagaceae bacterium]MCC7377966.1 FMN-binding negative transcriptional regulator [Chitinophagaceae bacterium]